MFVKSKMGIPMKYYKGSECFVLKPNTVTYIDETKVSARELRDCYGHRIEVLTVDAEEIQEMPKIERKSERKEVKLEERKEDLTDASLLQILEQVENELEAVTETAEEAVTETAEETVTETAETAEETVTETAEEAEETVTETAEEAEETVTETAEEQLKPKQAPSKGSSTKRSSKSRTKKSTKQ